MNFSDTEKTAELLGFDPDATARVMAFAERARSETALAEVFTRIDRVFADTAPNAVLDAVRTLDLEHTIERRDARKAHLLVALQQVPLAAARHTANDIPQDISRATLGDVTIWMKHTKIFTGEPGLPLEAFDWTQHYLCGNLLRFGNVQFDPLPFHAPVRAYRHKETEELVAISLADGGRAIDLRTGLVIAGAPPELGDAWEIAVEPGRLLLELHTPEGGSIVAREVIATYRVAAAFFGQRRGEKYLGLYGEGWHLDPQMPKLLAGHPAITEYQRLSSIYPSQIPEEKTVRRFFGPDATRAAVAAFPRDKMRTMQRVLADFLSRPDTALRACGAFCLEHELAGAERA